MIKFTLFLFAVFFFSGLNAQNYAVQRGHFDDDIYVYGWRNLYHDTDNPVDFYHITGYGTHLGLQYSIEYPAASSDLNLRNFTADPTPGLLFCTSFNEYETPIYKSIDFGKSWELLETEFPYSAPPIALLGGVVPGEVIMTVRLNSATYGIAFTDDYFATQQLKQTYYWYFTKPESGNTAGEIFGIKNDYTSNFDFILHSTDYGLSVVSTPIDSSLVYNANSTHAVKLCHGALQGEVYLITSNPPVVDTLPYVYKIYHSVDNGISFLYKSTFSFGNSDVYTDFTGGREAGSFYVVNWHYKADIQKQILQVYYSSNYASGFELNEFLLDQFVENEKPGNTDLIIYPNPADLHTVIRWDAQKDIENVTITDLSGKKLRNYSVGAGHDQLEIESAELKNGLYFVTLKGFNIESETLKLIVKH